MSLAFGCALAGACVEHSTSLSDGGDVPAPLDGSIVDAHVALPDAATGHTDAATLDATPPQPEPAPRSRTVIPPSSWTCGMPSGIPALDSAQAVFDLQTVVGDVYDVGKTPFGDRRVYALHGGTARGVHFQGSVWIGGLDYELTRDNGVQEIEQVSVITPIDGGAIYMRSCGVTPIGADEARMVFDFEAPSNGPYAWLNQGTFIGARTLDPVSHSVHLQVFQVGAGIEPAVELGAPIRVTVPADARVQPWDCPTPKSGSSSVLYSADVALTDPTLYVGSSKRGTRFVVPITGGVSSGWVEATVLRGGGDFHLVNGLVNTMDARSTMRTKDGALVIVRICGPQGQLSTYFETCSTGSAALLNVGAYRSDDPGFALGGVHIVVHTVP